MNNHGVTIAGGLGQILAEWILKGQPNVDVYNLDMTRFLANHTNHQYLYERVPEVASFVFKNLHNNHQCATARNLRMSPISHCLGESGAVFGEIMGYERPLWFNKDHKKNEKGKFQSKLLGKTIIIRFE